MFHYAFKDLNAAKRFHQMNLITISCICTDVTQYNKIEDHKDFTQPWLV